MSEPAATYEVNEATEISVVDSQLLELETAKRRGPGRPFQPGQSGNPYGRAGNPAKRTMITELRRKADKQAGTLATAAIDAAKRGNVRALAFIRDTAYGVPATKLVIENADSPASELLMRMMAAKGLALPVPPEVLNDRIATPRIENPHEVIDADDIRPG